MAYRGGQNAGQNRHSQPMSAWSSCAGGGSHRLEITTGELLPNQEIPLLKSRQELTQAEALKLWEEKRKAGWRP